MAIEDSSSQATGTATITKEADESIYERLCGLVDVEPFEDNLKLDSFADAVNLAEMSLNKRITAGIQVFLELATGSDQEINRIDKSLLDNYIAQIDSSISKQLDQVLHHDKFQQVESTWRGLKYLVDHTDFRSNIKVEMLDCDKETLREDFEDAAETIHTGLYKHIYVDEYDTPGGQPVSTIIGTYEFDSSPQDIAMLTEVSKVAAAAHCPFLSSTGPSFFKKGNVSDLPQINDISTYMEKAEFIRWRSFREKEDSRYVGLTLPRYLLRLPYGQETNPVRSFNYEEEVSGADHSRYLWGNAAFAFAANISRSFAENGWAVNIRGPEAGGKVEDLPVHLYDAGKGSQVKIPSEILIPETRELELANLGFIPLSYYKNSDYACFFSASSAHKPQEYSTPEATANSRINARLPYIYLISRIAHYLKVIQRENIGSTKNRQVLEDELNDWIQKLVTKMKDPDPELIATHPLREGKVIVKEIPENPGYYSVSLYVIPHFQVEGVDIKLSLVAQMPRDKD
ncbi:MAG: type VI secretion system contractile sheath large subunit [Thermodesulfobacteriota bacterium]